MVKIVENGGSPSEVVEAPALWDAEGVHGGMVKIVENGGSPPEVVEAPALCGIVEIPPL